MSDNSEIDEIMQTTGVGYYPVADYSHRGEAPAYNGDSLYASVSSSLNSRRAARTTSPELKRECERYLQNLKAILDEFKSLGYTKHAIRTISDMHSELLISFDGRIWYVGVVERLDGDDLVQEHLGNTYRFKIASLVRKNEKQ